MKLCHYSVRPISKIDDTNQDLLKASKPSGFWVSDEDDYGWKEWTASENFYSADTLYEYEITLSNSANILRLNSAADIDAFSHEWKSPIFLNDSYYIDWREVAQKYDGILITPYIYQRRLHPDCSWYYGWDVASGCIWNSKAVKSFSLINVAQNTLHSI